MLDGLARRDDQVSPTAQLEGADRYVDDAAVLTALVLSIREAAKDVVVHTQEAASEVVSQAISEAKEAWARRGVSQVCLSLWGATLAASVGLLYFGARRTMLEGAEAIDTSGHA